MPKKDIRLVLVNNRKEICFLKKILSIIISIMCFTALCTITAVSYADEIEPLLNITNYSSESKENQNLSPTSNDYSLQCYYLNNSIKVNASSIYDNQILTCSLYEDDFDTDINMDSLVVKPAIDSTQITSNCCFEFNLDKLHSEYTVILTKLINNQETIVAQSTVKVNIETPKIEIKEISGKSVVLQFSNENTEGYELYRNDKLVANFNQNTYEDTDLQPETSYTYKVRSYKKIDNKKVYSDFSKEVEVRTLSQYGLPDVSGECKTYAYYTAVTATGSPQYKLLNGPNCYTDTKTGIRMVDDCYCIALGSYYGSTIGTKYKIRLSSGQSFNAILCDQKSNRHTDENHQYAVKNKDIIEFYVQGGYIPSSVNGSYNTIFSGSVVSIEQLSIM